MVVAGDDVAKTDCEVSSSNDDGNKSRTNNNEKIHVSYRVATPTDLFTCYDLEQASYVKGEAATKSELQHRQHHAAKFFHVAVLEKHDDGDEFQDEDDKAVIGYVCSTRYNLPKDYAATSDVVPTTHQPHTSTLILHSVVVQEEYRRQGVGTGLIKNYIQSIKSTNMSLERPISKIALMVKPHLLTFFLHCGFSVICPAKPTPQRQMYYLEYSLRPDCRNFELFTTSSSSDNNNSKEKDGRECYIVDSFAATAGSGNPAAVVKLSQDFDCKSQSKWMQMVAAEFNLSETAFIWPTNKTPPSNSSSSNISSTHLDCISNDNDASNNNNGSSQSNVMDEIHWNIRYYTPTSEIPLCGHATLASAAILYMTIPGILNTNTKVIFEALEDSLTMELATATGAESCQQQQPEQQPLRIVMEFPTKPAKELVTRDDQSALTKMLTCAFSCDLSKESVLYMGISDIGDVLIELTPPAFQQIGYEHLNIKALLEWDGYYRGVIICCQNPDTAQDAKNKASDENEEEQQQTGTVEQSKDASSSSVSAIVPDFFSRFFGPKAGINEDPVTGSAHCVLGPYFAQKLNKSKVIGKQKSAREGLVECEMTDHNTVRLTGTAVPTMNGTLWM